MCNHYSFRLHEYINKPKPTGTLTQQFKLATSSHIQALMKLREKSDFDTPEYQALSDKIGQMFLAKKEITTPLSKSNNEG